MNLPRLYNIHKLGIPTKYSDSFIDIENMLSDLKMFRMNKQAYKGWVFYMDHNNENLIRYKKKEKIAFIKRKVWDIFGLIFDNAELMKNIISKKYKIEIDAEHIGIDSEEHTDIIKEAYLETLI